MDVRVISGSGEVYRNVRATRSPDPPATDTSERTAIARYDEWAERDTATRQRKASQSGVPAKRSEQRAIAEKRLSLSNSELPVSRKEIDLESALELDKAFLNFSLETNVVKEQYAMNKIVLGNREQIINNYRNVQALQPSSQSTFEVYA